MSEGQWTTFACKQASYVSRRKSRQSRHLRRRFTCYEDQYGSPAPGRSSRRHPFHPQGRVNVPVERMEATTATQPCDARRPILHRNQAAISASLALALI
jgi:hypothetical protein